MNLSNLFSPKSIAIYGVSNNPDKIGSVIFMNLISSEFEGDLYPINPKYEDLLGYKCYPNIRSIKNAVNLAVMAIPAENILDVLDDCYEKKVKTLVVISSGFGESGTNGKILEEKMIFKAKKYGIDILGPNCLGLISTKSKMNASFAASNSESGNIALISQSGAVCTSFLDMANVHNLGFSHLISVGNKTMINENHLLEDFLKDEDVRVIGAYLEEFSNGRKFLEMKEKMSIQKPIIVMAPGQTEEAQSAIKSHTGSLTSSHKVISIALEKHGIIQAENLSEMFSLLNSFSWIDDLPKGKNVAIVTNAGGIGILATDAIVKSGLNIAKLSAETISKLKSALPESAHINNPIDVIGDAKADRYEYCLNSLSEAKEVDSILVILTPQLVTEIEDTAKLLTTITRKLSKPVIPVFLGGEYVGAGVKRLHNNKVICFSDINLAINTLDKLTKYSEYISGNKQKSQDKINFKKKINLKKYIHNTLTPLPEEVVYELLSEFDLPVPETYVVDSPEEAVHKAEKIGYPLVIKATTEDITHKTDVKAIFLNISNDEELRKKSSELQKNIISVTKKNTASFIIQEQLKADAEIFIGMKRDDNFGSVILFGSGGIYTEVYEDISEMMIPLSKQEISGLVDSTRISKIINGVRGKSRLDKRGLIEVIEQIQNLVLTYPEIAEIDINPVMVMHNRTILADIKIFMKSSN